MKKEDVVFILVVISILLISINLVSASLIGDAWGKITGRPIDENVTDNEPEDYDEVNSNEDEEEPKPCPTIIAWRVEDNKCVSDSGCDYDDSKYTYYGEEECESQLEASPEPPPGKECEEGEMRYYGCPDGTKVPNCECESNMWVCKIFKDENCPDVGHEPKTCAAKIQITFNKDIFKIGDDVKIIIETFDSQGNHVPNYAFYGQMYDDRWHTPDLQKTDNEGYLIHTGIAEKPGGGVTEVKFKVYTKESSSCGSVEDTAEVKFESGDCGLGECEPELGCKDKIRMCGGKCTPCPEDDGEIFYPCAGCELEEKCYPYGFRKAGNYCSDEDDLFVAQSGDDGKCENNFECKTNLCINGNCVSDKLWNKFLGWFKKMFGGGDDEEPGPKECSKVLIEEDIGDYEYNQSLYGPKDMQVPVYSEDGTQMDIVKCCVAQYLHQDQSEKQVMGLVCQYDSKEEVKNSLRWIAAKDGNLDLGEYKGEKLIRDERNSIVIWISDTYIVASGGDPNQRGGLVEQVADAYLKRYSNDFDLTEDNIPVIINDKPFVFCTEEDGRLIKECQISGGMFQSNPSALDGTEEGKKSCIDSKGFGEGCCEVFAGCANNCGEIIHIPDRNNCYIDLAIKNKDVEVCEKIDDSDRRNKCYINVAEHTGDSGICDKVGDSSLREKCYFWVAGQTGESDTCTGIVDAGLQAMCYVEVAEEKSDANFCDKITDSYIRDKCYRDVGIQTNNKVLCEKIIEDKAKQKCLDNTS